MGQARLPGAALSVIRDGEIIYKRGYGMANLEYDIPIAPTTIFDIASVSKQLRALPSPRCCTKGNSRWMTTFGRTCPMFRILEQK